MCGVSCVCVHVCVCMCVVEVAVCVWGDCVCGGGCVGSNIVLSVFLYHKTVRVKVSRL